MATTLYPCLWFDGQAQEAADYYCSIFPNSSILESNPQVVTYELDGRRFMHLNGGPQFQFTEAISMVVNCRDQAEIDYYWERLSAGGSEGRCGWLKDRYGLSWQVVPTILATLMGDPGKAPFVVAAFMKMNKFILADLLQAAENS